MDPRLVQRGGRASKARERAQALEPALGTGAAGFSEGVACALPAVDEAAKMTQRSGDS